jgi:hypothetical protein
LEIFNSGGWFAIGEDDHTCDATGFDGLSELLGAEGEAVVEIGRVAGLELGDTVFDRLFVGDFLGRHEDFDNFIEDDDGEDVVGAEQVDKLTACLLGEFDWLAFHRPAAVDDEAEVERGTVAGHLHSGESTVGWGGDFEEELFAGGAVCHCGFAGGGEDKAKGLAGGECGCSVGIAGYGRRTHGHGLVAVHSGVTHDGSVGVDGAGDDCAVWVVLVHESAWANSIYCRLI